MNKKINYLILFFFLMISGVHAQGGGGGVLIETEPSEFELCMIDNCDSFCKESSSDEGEYYKENLCWCTTYKDVKSGKIVLDDGWIEIEECLTSNNPSIEIVAIQKIVLVAIVLLILVVVMRVSNLIKK